MDLRLRHFEKGKDAAAAGRRRDVDALNRTDAESLFAAASFHAVTAAVIRATDSSRTRPSRHTPRPIAPWRAFNKPSPPATTTDFA